MKRFYLGLCLALALPLCGCIGGLALDGLAAVDLAADGAIAEGVAARSVVTEAGTTRLLVSDSLGEAATSRGVLPEALSRITNNGTQTAVLSVDTQGVISAGTRPVARFAANNLVATSGETIGALDDGWIYEVQNGVRGRAVARLHAFVPGSLMRLQTDAALGSGSFDKLFVEVLRVDGDKYLIRLPDASILPVEAPMAMLVLLPADNRPQCPEADGTLVRTSGRSVTFDRCTRAGDVFRLDTARGLVVIDANDVTATVPGPLMIDADSAAIWLTGGYSIFGRADREGDVIKVRASNGDLLVADAARVAPDGSDL